MSILLPGCGGEPSPRELKNRQELEALLSAVALKDAKQVELDAKRIDDRHASGELSDAAYGELREVVKDARAGDWAGAEKRGYALRESKPYFK
ncbi:MAG TPA: hypothetical protein VG406_23960 [Isosphaeraceae bacterium]|jgi:hypothetical protein|nr:hypothetical protein [Isosphaeraceae bacterium]